MLENFQEKRSLDPLDQKTLGVDLMIAGASATIIGAIGIDVFEAESSEEGRMSITLDIGSDSEVHIVPEDFVFGGIALAGLAVFTAGVHKFKQGWRRSR